MNYAKKLGKTFLYSIKDNKTGFILLLIICVVLITSFVMVAVSTERDNSDFAESMKATVRLINLFVAFFSAAIIPICMFSYQCNRRKADFFNSMPITRAQYFISYTVSGFAMYLVSVVFMNVVFMITLAPQGLSGIVFSEFWKSLIMFYITYSISIFATMISNSVLMSLVVFGFLNGGFCVIILLLGSMSRFFDGLLMEYINMYLNDLMYILTPSSVAFQFVEDSTVDNATPLFVNVAVMVISTMYFAASFFLHRIRRSEASVGIVFNKLRYPFQYAVLTIGTLFFALMFGEIALSMSWLFVGAAIGAVVCFVLTNMVFEMSAKNAFRRIRHMFISLGVIVVLILVFASDIFMQFRTYPICFTPDYVTVEIYSYNDDYYIEEKKKITDQAVIDKLTEYAIEELSLNEDDPFALFNKTEYDSYLVSGSGFGMLLIIGTTEESKSSAAVSVNCYYDIESKQNTEMAEYVWSLFDVNEFEKNYYDVEKYA